MPAKIQVSKMNSNKFAIYVRLFLTNYYATLFSIIALLLFTPALLAQSVAVPNSYKTGNSNAGGKVQAQTSARPVPASLASASGKSTIGGGARGNGQSAAVSSSSSQNIINGNSATSSVLPTSPTLAADNGTSVNCDGPPTRCELSGRRDFNSILSGGVRGQPGVKARLNAPAFRYLSQQFVGILNYRLRRFQLPPINQCLPQVQGCVRVPNPHISNYKCTNDVNVHSAPPNQLIIDVNGLDVSVEGNLGGQVAIMVPMALYGHIHADAYRVHVRLAVVLVNNGSWPALQVASCSASVGRLQLDIQNGGLLGDIARQQLQAKLTKIVRQQFSRQICSRVPQILNQEINSKIPTLIPEKLSLNTLVGMAIGQSCISKLIGLGGDEETEAGAEATSTSASVRVRKQRCLVVERDVPMPAAFPLNQSSSPRKRRRAIGASPLLKDNEVKQRRQSGGDAKGREEEEWITPEPEGKKQDSGTARGGGNAGENGTGTTSTVGSASAGGGAENTDVEAAAADADAAAAGTGDSGGGGGGAASFLPILTSLIDLTKFENIYLNLQYLNSEATQNSYTVGIRGGFSQCAWGCTPFSAFPMQAPQCGGNCKMADVLISDFTINSLLYHLHRVGFFLFNITPDTPELGKLMSLNCDESASDSGDSSVFFLEDHGVELENGTMTKGAESGRALKEGRRRRARGGGRTRRQGEEEGAEGGGSCLNVDSVVELGFCIGSFLPAAKEENEAKGGHEKVDLKIRTEQAPNVLIRENGTVALEFDAFLDFLYHSTGAKITTFHVDLVLNANVKVEGDDFVKAKLEIAKLHVQDVGGKSGLEQETLDTLINLVAEKILECANSIVAGGCKIEVPEGIGGLPLNLSNLKIGFVEHGLHLQSDFKLSEDSDVFGGTEPCNNAVMRRGRRAKKVRRMN